MGNCTRAGSLVTMMFAGALVSMGQQGAFQAPTSGYVFDSYANAIRPVIGYVGSAYLGAAVVPAEWASISPDSRSAWVWQEGHLRFLPALTQEAALDWPGLTKPDQAVWSNDGKKSMLLAQGTVAVVVRNEGGDLQLEGEFKVSDGSALRLLAASTDLRMAALAVRANDDAPWDLLLWQAGGETRSLASLAEPGAAAFDGAGLLYVADAVKKRILRIALDSDAGAPEEVLAAEQGIDSPCALVKLAGSLIVVERDARVVRRYALESKTIDREEALDEAPGMLSALGNNRYLLNQRTRKQQSVLILDLTGDPKVSFVPAGE